MNEAEILTLLPGTEVGQCPTQMMSAGAKGNKEELGKQAGKEKAFQGVN